MKITRRQFIGYTALAGVGALGVDGLLIEPCNVEFTHHDIGTPVSGQRPLRFAQLTDLHFGALGVMHHEIAEKLIALDLDLILLTGDIVDTNYDLPALDQFLRLFPHDLPKLAILGNWEHWGHVHLPSLHRLYEQRNGMLLVNTTTTVAAGGLELLVTGLDCSVGGVPSLETALAGVEPAEHHIVLAHCPSYRDYLTDYNRLVRTDSSRITIPIDFDQFHVRGVFSGHTHGGQVNLLGFRPFLPQGSGRYLEGWYRDAAPHLYVSRGIGTSILPVRIGARPEVALFSLWS